MIRFIRASMLAAIAMLFTTEACAADSFPNRPMRLIVPFSPGGGTDITARILAEPLGEVLGTTVVVDNRPGAGTIIGTELAVKAEPDGYTLLLGTISTTVNPAIYKKLPYDIQRDLAPITRVSDQPSILVVTPDSGIKTLEQVIDNAREKPGRYEFGSPGFGTAAHLAAELLWQTIGVKLIHVPFKGTGPALTALLSHDISIYMSSFASALPHVSQRRLNALAVTTTTRAKPLPNVPTLAEAGVKGYEYSSWYALFAPVKTSPGILRTLHDATVKALKSPELFKAFETQGLNATPMSSKDFAAYIAAETRKWAAAAKKANISIK